MEPWSQLFGSRLEQARRHRRRRLTGGHPNAGARRDAQMGRVFPRLARLAPSQPHGL